MCVPRLRPSSLAHCLTFAMIWGQVVPACLNNAVDATGVCCPSGLADAAGGCCSAGAVLDGPGLCCSSGYSSLPLLRVTLAEARGCQRPCLLQCQLGYVVQESVLVVSAGNVLECSSIAKQEALILAPLYWSNQAVCQKCLIARVSSLVWSVVSMGCQASQSSQGAPSVLLHNIICTGQAYDYGRSETHVRFQPIACSCEATT